MAYRGSRDENIDSALDTSHVRDGLRQLTADLPVKAFDQIGRLGLDWVQLIGQAKANSIPVARSRQGITVSSCDGRVSSIVSRVGKKAGSIRISGGNWVRAFLVR